MARARQFICVDSPSMAAQPSMIVAICRDRARVMPPSAITGRRDNRASAAKRAMPSDASPGCVRVAKTGEIKAYAHRLGAAFARRNSVRSWSVTSRISPPAALSPGAP